MEILEIRERIDNLTALVDPWDSALDAASDRLWTEQQGWHERHQAISERLENLPDEWALMFLQGREGALNLADLRKEVENVQDHVAALDLAKKIHQSQSASLRKYKTKLAEVSSLYDELVEQEAEISHTQETVKINEQKIDEMRSEITNLYEKLKANHHDRDAKSQIEDLESDIEQLKNQNRSTRALAEVGDEMVARTQSQIAGTLWECDRILEQARADGWLPPEDPEAEKPEAEAPAVESEKPTVFQRLFKK